MSAGSRSYHQVARAAATEALRQRIVAEFLVLFTDHRLDDITLDDLAARAGTTRQTIIRFFGGKDGLVDALADHVHQAMLDRPDATAPALDLRQFTDDLVTKYDAFGAATIHALAQEQRHAGLARVLARGRANHRAHIQAALAPWLDRLPERGADRMDALVAATDVYAWHLLRRDLGRSPEQVARTMHITIAALLTPSIPEPEGDPS